jgi:hypothetical protein
MSIILYNIARWRVWLIPALFADKMQFPIRQVTGHKQANDRVITGKYKSLIINKE